MWRQPAGIACAHSICVALVRDDFKQTTKDLLAKRVGYHCSNPECGAHTVGPRQGDEGVMNVGVAAHITAASPDGPRYDPSLSPEQRRHPSNGIWLCQNHGKLVDSDEGHFSVEMPSSGCWMRSLGSVSSLLLAPSPQTWNPPFRSLSTASACRSKTISTLF